MLAWLVVWCGGGAIQLSSTPLIVVDSTEDEMGIWETKRRPPFLSSSDIQNLTWIVVDMEWVWVVGMHEEWKEGRKLPVCMYVCGLVHTIWVTGRFELIIAIICVIPKGELSYSYTLHSFPATGWVEKRDKWGSQWITRALQTIYEPDREDGQKYSEVRFPEVEREKSVIEFRDIRGTLEVYYYSCVCGWLCLCVCYWAPLLLMLCAPYVWACVLWN